MNDIILSPQEKKWILAQRLTRLTDQKECLIYPMGAERHLSSVLLGNQPAQYNLKPDIEGKSVLVIPGYGNTAFLFAQAGATSITVYDKDPVTIAWMKAYKKYYHYSHPQDQNQHYPSVGELLTALTCWYPPLLRLPFGKFKHALCFLFAPKQLRRVYFFYMLSLVQHAISSKVDSEFELDKDIQFHAEEIHQRVKRKEKQVYDTAFVPYLLGVRHGIEHENDIVRFIKELIQLVPQGPILITPSQNKKEFHLMGKRYFETTNYDKIEAIPKLLPYFSCSDNHWYDTQGLAIFRGP